MPITRTAMIDDDGSGTIGTVINNAWKVELYNQIDAVVPGAYTPIPHNQVNFTVSAGVWTVDPADQIIFSYCLVSSNTMFLTFDLRTTALSLPAQFMFLKIPAGRVVRGPSSTAFTAFNNNAFVAGAAYAAAGQAVVYLLLPNVGNWTAGVTSLMGTAILDVTTAAEFRGDPDIIDPNDPRWRLPG